MPLVRVLAIGAAAHAEKLAALSADWLPNQAEKKFTILHRHDEARLASDLAEFRPHVIVIEADTRYPLLSAMSLAVRGRTVNALDKPGPELAAYILANITGPLMTVDRFRADPLVSIFTPTYATPKEAFLRAYESLKAQSYTHWEWVIYDDSDHMPKVIKEPDDHRVRVYSSLRHSGSIGEVKRNACGLCRGEVLVELDHDDELTPGCLQHLVAAFQKFPDAGFAYGDCIEWDADSNKPRARYAEGWGFGYGSYRTEEYRGQPCDVTVTPPVNAKTIRYITAAPNHVRAWRSSAYWAAGGHNPSLDVADDYDLLVRTFLTTRMVHVQHLGYIQNFHSHNSQSSRLAEIQRLTTLVEAAYEQRIHDRLLALGVPDYPKQADGSVNMETPAPSTPHHCNYEYKPPQVVAASPREEGWYQGIQSPRSNATQIDPCDSRQFSLAVVTACTRPENIAKIHASLGSIPIHWVIVEDIDKLGQPVQTFESIHKVTILCHTAPGADHVGGQCVKNRGLEFILNTSKEKWVYFLDDDNIFLPELVRVLQLLDAEQPQTGLAAWPQYLEDRTRPVDIRTYHIDQAQYAVRTDCIGEARIPLNYRGDGEFITALAAKHPVYIHDKPLCFYNRLAWSLPLF